LPGRGLERFGLGPLRRRKLPRLSDVPATLAALAKCYAGLRSSELPDPDKALRTPDGLAGLCADMSVPTLISAYAKGLFPSSHIGPLTWWAPKERMVLFPENSYVSKSVRRLIKQFDVTFDSDFEAVIEACAGPQPGRPTSISVGSIDAYAALHAAGYAHSVEVWDRAGALVGGLYGVAVGKVFFIESMFSRARDASKVGFATLSCHLQHWGFVLIDGKRMSGYLSQLGFTLIPRTAFNGLLATACREPSLCGRWIADKGLDVSRWNPRAPRRPSSAKPFHSTVFELS
jgi:leucyl/phenylalanyl-tRNA--protein transferase